MTAAPAAGRFRIDQALHGYRQGHRWLGGSIRLEGAAEATLLALTDLLTSDLAPGQSSYLSGYPLKEANRYVLSRTWLAPESPRPGSVWSHSLILDYAALSLIDDLASLLSLFRRPQGTADPYYAKPVSPSELARLVAKSKAIHPDRIFRERGEKALNAIYGRKAARNLSLMAEEPEADEALAVALWRQMWPGLRRDFAFFTRVRGEVAEVSAGFALYFRTDAFQSRPTAARDAVETAAYQILWRDLLKPGPTDLREFLGRYAVDAPDPRRTVPDLVLMQERMDEPASVALDLAGRYAGAAALPRLKRDILLQAMHSDDAATVTKVVGALRNEPLVVSDEELGHLVSASLGRERQVVGHIIAAASPSQEGELGDAVLRAMAAQASAADLAQANVGDETRRKLLSLRPDLAAESEFWPGNSADRLELLQMALGDVEQTSSLLAALGSRLTPAEAIVVLGHGGPPVELAIFDAMRDQLPDRDAWSVIQQLLRRPGFLQREAEQVRSIGLPLVDAMIGELLPEVPLQAESWLEMARREAGPGPLQTAAANLVSGALIAGLSAPMPAAARLIELAFDAIYEGLDRWSFPSRLRDLLEVQLGRRSKEWRLVDKLVAAVVDKYGGPDRADPWVLLVTGRSDALQDIVERIERKGSKGSLEALVARAEAQRRQELAPRIQYLRSEIERHDARWTW